jgi:steroid 5-alpha reductase family enzyme
VGVWGVRLSSFLFYRALQYRTDGRLDDTLATPAGAAGFWAASCLWGVVCLLPHTLGAGVCGSTAFAAATASARLPRLSRVGAWIAAEGVALEAVADLQKWFFKQDPANKGKHCDVGMWFFCQHPNWFGNLCVWGGIYLVNWPLLRGLPGYRRHAFPLVALASPLFLFALFTGQATGTITNSVELAHAKYGHDPAYRRYVKDTPLIVPIPKKRSWD